MFYTVVLGGVIFLCRFLPFIIFKEKTGTEKSKDRIRAFLEFVEAAVPATAMTVLAVNALASAVKETLAVQPQDLAKLVPMGTAALVTAILHLLKRNALISIFGGTALYMLLNSFVL
jgi:branched-subunit amino acid transport protein AzlD